MSRGKGRVKVFYKNGYTKRFKINGNIDLGENDYKGFITVENGKTTTNISKKEIDYIKIKLTKVF